VVAKHLLQKIISYKEEPLLRYILTVVGIAMLKCSAAILQVPKKHLKAQILKC
jgi:hypothetical protein